MTPEQINIAIAEFHFGSWDRMQKLTDGLYILLNSGWKVLPDYYHDLNACHEAEKKLTPDQEEQYVERLGSMLMEGAYEGDLRWVNSHLSSGDSTYRATAPQRCEALLRTIGK
jgi:hypothetical protein